MRYLIWVATLFVCINSWAQSPPNAPQFEVASIRPVPRATTDDERSSQFVREIFRNMRQPGEIPMASPDRISLNDWTILDLTAAAYGVRPTQVLGPDWIAEQGFDIQATVPAGTPKAALKAGMFPMPDPRHASWQFLMFPILLAPLLLLVTLWREGTALRSYLLCNLVALLATLPFMFHKIAPIFAEGTMRRLFAVVVFVPVGVAAFALVYRYAHKRFSERIVSNCLQGQALSGVGQILLSSQRVWTTISSYPGRRVPVSIKHEIFCLLLIGICSSRLGAQTPAYHSEYDEAPNGFIRMVLVNDSDKTIEAFHATERCSQGGSEQSADTLDFPVDSIASISGPDGRFARRGVVEPGGRWTSSLFESTPTATNCDVQIEAVLFGDGTYDGSDAAVEELKARRDGIAAGVQLWVEKLSTNDGVAPTEETLHAEAVSVTAQDTAQRNKYRHGPQGRSEDFASYGYWAGRVQVDINILHQFAHGAKTKEAPVDLTKLTDMVSRWSNKVNTNAALKRLDVTFPPAARQATNGKE